MQENEFKKYVKKWGTIGAFFLVALLFYLLSWRGALLFYGLLSAGVLVLMILLQSGRGGGLASLGGMDGQSFLGTHSATPISKATYVVGVLFVVICLLVARLGTVSMEGRPRPEQRGQPTLGTGGGYTHPLMPSGRGEAGPGASAPEDSDQEGTSPE